MVWTGNIIVFDQVYRGKQYQIKHTISQMQW